jgi:hypothetical protein
MVKRIEYQYFLSIFLLNKSSTRISNCKLEHLHTSFYNVGHHSQQSTVWTLKHRIPLTVKTELVF